MKQNNFNCYITIDFEEWYHIEYLKKYNVSNFNETCCDKIDDFLDNLKNNNIPSTIFVVSDVCKSNSSTLSKAVKNGNKIGCHTSCHQNLKSLTTAEFSKMIIESKSIIENVLNTTVDAFRAPSFSANMEKINALKSIGFKFDSSYINSNANEYYQNLNFQAWDKLSGCIYSDKSSSFKEYEIPTCKLVGKRIPISGGGFFRLVPLFLLKILISKYIKKNNYYMFFIHPYEICGIDLSISKTLPFKYRFRLNYGRKRAQKKFWKLIKFLKQKGAAFKKLGEN